MRAGNICRKLNKTEYNCGPQVFGPSRMFGKFELTFELQIRR